MGGVIMLDEICREVRNWFVKSDHDKLFGNFEIQDGIIIPSINLKPKQYYRVIGSLYNDGIHQEGVNTLEDEDFNGAIWRLYIPKDFLLLVDEIKAYNEKYGEITPFTSETFGGYSYSKATNSNGVGVNWKDVFKSRLNQWRKL